MIVVFAGTSWDGVAGSDRLLATELAAHTDVLWVDPPISAATPDRYRYGASRLGMTPLLRRVSPSSHRLTPRALPMHTRPYVKVSTAALLRSQARRALRRLGRRPAAVMACNLVDVLRGWEPGVTKVLYGTDDFVAGAALMGHDADRVAADERRQLANADLVVAISTVLAERWTSMGARRVELIPNGVQTSAYRDLSLLSPAPEAGGLASPVAGVIGQFSDRTDFDLLAALADDGISLLLVGPHDARWEPERFPRLVARPNVVWVGRQPFEKVPSFLRAVDVGVTPYRDTPFNRASFPLKTLEYLGAGKPAVSTDLPAVHWLDSPLVRVANTPKELVAAVREAAAESSVPELVAARREFAEQHSWTQRAATLASVLGLSHRHHNTL
ncbi:glycosyltransferase [Dactylosporangium roseum]|uniref:Glycosyltransferase n=1 Tax=Dactylosporangium roseum TaxID=47989 RepID=A0ABY5Z7S0_9ACTN|nr:glycosyltransferase [Dactylosporangium roseum]UWZ36768.1 glycosyltransferase [Dactylosporangium roseum]